MKKINNHAELEKMIKKYLSGQATSEEQLFLETYFEQFEKDEDRLSTFSATHNRELEREIETMIDDQIAFHEKAKSWKLPVWATAAAVLLVIFSLGMYFFGETETQRPAIALVDIDSKTDIDPGGNKAILTLADGRKISLNDVKAGTLAQDAGVSISKAKDGQLVYDLSGVGTSSSLAFNAIETPKGGTYQVILPDGTKTWLNAASKLIFPTTFKGNQRKVELLGEAYFEVAKDKHKPFFVSSGNQMVQVLGTHFNVSAYADDQTIKTTLLEGSVRVAKVGTDQLQVLKPGQQSSLGKTGHINIATVNTQNAIDWKDGRFVFARENLSSIMKKIARWYNVEVDFEGKLNDERFVGEISRTVKLSEILHMLASTEVAHFKIIPGDKNGKGRRVIVMP